MLLPAACIFSKVQIFERLSEEGFRRGNIHDSIVQGKGMMSIIFGLSIFNAKRSAVSISGKTIDVAPIDLRISACSSLLAFARMIGIPIRFM